MVFGIGLYLFSFHLGLSAHQVILVFVLDLGLFLIWSRKGHATKGHLIVYNLLYLPPIKGKTVLYLKIIFSKGTISAILGHTNTRFVHYVYCLVKCMCKELL